MKNLKDLDLTKKKYIIFDMDGTLIDSIGIWNITDHKVINEFAHKDIDLSIIQQEREEFLVNNQEKDIYLEYCDYLIKKYNLNISKEDLLKYRWQISGKILENDIDFKPYVVDVIKKLKSLGYTLVLATVTTRTQIDIYSNRNKKMLKQMNIKDYFDLIITKEDISKKKPNPEIYLKILEIYNANSDECLVIEDSLSGIMAAKEAGIETINIYDSYSDNDREEIDKLTDYKIESYEEFLYKINNLKDN